MKTCWEILEIEITKDIKTIRHAYSKKIKQYHPEDDPQMYQSIRKAYQDAKEYAKADEDVENYQDNFQIVKESNQEKYISNLKDDNERLFINPQEFIDNEKKVLYQQVDCLYNSENINNIEAWNKLIADNQEYLIYILDYVLKLGINKITNEQVIGCLSNCIKDDSSKCLEVKEFDKKYDELRKKAAKGYRILDFLFVVITILMILLSLVLLVVTLFKAAFINDDMVIINLCTFAVSILTFLQGSKMFGRIYDSNSRFYYRNHYLVLFVVVWVLIDSYYIFIGYQYFFGKINLIMVLINLAINIIMYFIMHTKKYLEAVNRKIKPSRDLTVLAIPYALMIVFVVITGIFFLIRVNMTKNLHYFIVLIVALSALYSNVRAVFLAIKDKPVYYHLKNMNAVLVVNGFCSICSFNIMFHYLFNPMVINKRNYILSICSVFLAIICFFLYRIINKNRKKQYLEAFTMSDRYLAVNRIYEFIKEKCNDGKEFKEVTTFELNFYLVGSLLETIETNFSSLYLDKSFLITDIYDALITMKLDNLGEIFKEANDKLFKDGYFDENDELLEFYQKRLKENEDQIYEIMHEYMVRNRSFFVYF